jgi:CubicO group peptidase (beta-lactamase class C family)
VGLNPLIDYDWSFSDFVQRVEDLQPQGFRLLSLSMYDNPSQPRFSAVWDKRAGPAWKWYLGYTLADLASVCAANQPLGFFPTVVTGTGGGAQTRISGIFEQLAAAQATALTLGQDLAAFAAEVTKRAGAGWMVRSATIHDAPGVEPRVSAVWEKNTRNVAWSAFAGLTADDHQRYFGGEYSGWARLAFVTASTQARFLAIYRDDQLGPIGRGFVARHGLTLEGFLAEQGAWLSKGFHTVCFQGYGSGSGRRYAAIFVDNEKPVQRIARTTGTPEVPEIDQAVLGLMKQSNIRGAALAVVSGTRLVLARGYTWAEPDYPPVQPTTLFRLASCSKLIAAVALHQLIAEGKVKPTDKLPAVLALETPTGGTPTNPAYLACSVDHLLEYDNLLPPRYEGKGVEIAAAFKTKLPVTHAQIASYMLTEPVGTSPDKLNDFGYFLAAELIKKLRGASSFVSAIGTRLLQPLQIERIRSARSLLTAQPSDEARFHSRDLLLQTSVMTPDRPLVPREYGDENLETMEASGGLSAAATDLARVLAALNSKPYTPLGRPAVQRLLERASITMPLTGRPGGHGFDDLDLVDSDEGLYRGFKGGLLQTSQSGLYYEGDGISYVIVWNGLHTKGDLTLDPGEGGEWYPKFTKVVDAARAQLASSTDLFPSFGMPSLPRTQANWRWCKKCQGLFFAGHNLGACPAGGTHVTAGSGDYHLINNSTFAYGQANWRWCKKCQALFFAGNSLGTCPSGGGHDKSGSGDYTLVHNSPYNEHQGNWRWCKKCQSLFFAGNSLGICPAGGTHDKTGSGNYALASG